MKGLHTGLYAGAEVGGLYGQASAAYSQYEADGRRDIDLPEVDPLQASADFKAQAGLASLSGGYDYRLDGWLLGPTIGLRYGRFQQDGFGESGAGFAGLKVDEAQNDSLTSTLGLQAATKLEWRGMEVMPRLTLEWRHEYQNREPEITARFAGYEDAPFRATGPAPVADLVVMQAGLTARVRERFSAFVDCSLDLGQDYSAQAVSLGLQYSY
jgi:outer membrane autotransporter protein